MEIGNWKLKIQLAAVLISAILLSGCSLLSPKTVSTPQEGSLAAVPANLVFASLTDVTGGQSKAVAARSYEVGKFALTIAANLPKPPGEEFYEGWLVRGKAGDADFGFISTGKLALAGDEYDLKFESDKDLTDHKNVIVTVESVDDGLPEKHVLEGSF